MRNLMLGGLALATLVGCNNGDGGIYLIQMPSSIDNDCTPTISENFINADPYEDIEVESDWIISEEEVESDSLFFAQIVKGKKKGYVLIIGNQVYPGEKDKDGYVFMWENSEQVDDSIEYAPSPYEYTQVSDRMRTTTVRFNKDRETGGFAGEWKTEVNSTDRITESDTWGEQVPIASGQIYNTASTYLEGDATNSPDVSDCDSNNCFIEIGLQCAASANFTAAWTAFSEEGTFEHVKGAGQPSGY